MAGLKAVFVLNLIFFVTQALIVPGAAAQNMNCNGMSLTGIAFEAYAKDSSVIIRDDQSNQEEVFQEGALLFEKAKVDKIAGNGVWISAPDGAKVLMTLSGCVSDRFNQGSVLPRIAEEVVVARQMEPLPAVEMQTQAELPAEAEGEASLSVDGKVDSKIDPEAEVQRLKRAHPEEALISNLLEQPTLIFPPLSVPRDVIPEDPPTGTFADVAGQAVTAERLENTDNKTWAVKLRGVDPNSFFGRAGVRDNDVVYMVDSQPYDGETNWVRSLSARKVSQSITVHVERDGRLIMLEARLL